MDTNNKKQWTVKPLAILIILIAIVSLSGITLARYVMEKREQGIVEADDYYFFSDLLKDASEKAEYYIDPGNKKFEIHLMNYADAQRITKKDIKFDVKVDNGSSDSTSGTLKGAAANTSTVMITPGDGADITVTVTSTSPYKKSLSAVFHRSLGNQYKVEDASGNRAAVLTMTCIDNAKSITITLPANVIPDASDERVTKSAEENTYQFKSPGNGVFSLVLLKTEPSAVLSGSGAFANEINLTNMTK